MCAPSHRRGLGSSAPRRPPSWVLVTVGRINHATPWPTPYLLREQSRTPSTRTGTSSAAVRTAASSRRRCRAVHACGLRDGGHGHVEHGPTTQTSLSNKPRRIDPRDPTAPSTSPDGLPTTPSKPHPTPRWQIDTDLTNPNAASTPSSPPANAAMTPTASRVHPAPASHPREFRAEWFGIGRRVGPRGGTVQERGYHRRRSGDLVHWTPPPHPPPTCVGAAGQLQHAAHPAGDRHQQRPSANTSPSIFAPRTTTSSSATPMRAASDTNLSHFASGLQRAGHRPKRLGWGGEPCTRAVNGPGLPSLRVSS